MLMLMHGMKAMPLLLLPLLLCSSLAQLKQQVDQQQQEERFSAMQAMVETYKREHGRAALAAESDEEVCKRSFVQSWHFPLTCSLFGNHVGSMLSNVVMAIVLNRTIVFNSHLGHTAGNVPIISECHDFLEMETWPITGHYLRNRLEQAGCPINFNEFVKVDQCDFDFRREAASSRHHERMMVLDRLGNQAYSMLHPKGKVRFDEPEAARAKLFLSGSDRYESYGMAASAVLNFTSQAWKRVSEVLGEGVVDRRTATERLRDKIVIGVHLRHYKDKSLDDPTMDEKEDVQVKSILSRLLSDSNSAMQSLIDSRTNKASHSLRGGGDNHRSWKDFGCMVLVASDRPTSLERVVQYAREFNCTGPWASSDTSISDLLLLSVSDFLIGTDSSTFSFLIANYVSTKAHNRYRFDYWVRGNKPHAHPPCYPPEAEASRHH